VLQVTATLLQVTVMVLQVLQVTVVGYLIFLDGPLAVVPGAATTRDLCSVNQE
jgi:hypothetical protein